MECLIKQITYENLNQESFRDPEATRYEIIRDGVKFDFLVNYKPQSPYAAVFGTGAILTTGKELPIFSRATWMDELSCTGIWYFDPTLYDHAGLTLAWG